MKRSHKNNIIICTLCLFVILMTIGYAAFAATLKISGTTFITSTWDIHLDSIEVSNTNGNAKDIPYDTSNLDGTRIDDTKAIFKTELVSPGDSITYTISVTNSGSLNAKLDEITVNNDNNPAIIYEVSGTNENEVIESGDIKYISKVITYSNSVTTQPSNLTSSLTVNFSFVQA